MAIEDGMLFLSYAAQALSRDEFSRCFEPKPTIQPTNHFMYWFYLLGITIRYGILFPIRLIVLLMASIIFLMILPICFVMRDPRLMRFLFRSYCQAWLFSFSAIIRYHGRKPNIREPHLFVANHTSFIDFFLMSSHRFPHATVAQVHGGLFGWFQRHALSLNGSLFFNRSEQKDRLAVSRKMQAHIDRKSHISPLIIFPEGTCVNNESTVLFHKGAFELDGLVCPVAIKYNKRLLDPYWNTREQSFTQHALYLMTRWMMIADVWWLPPQRRGIDESAIQFANRVKALISETAGLRNLSWDGYMKNCMQHKDQEKMRRTSQEKYVSALKRRLTPAPSTDTEGEVKSKSEQVIITPTPTSTSSYIRRRANSLITDPNNASLLGHSVPSTVAPISQLYLPNWLSEKAIVSIKNELMINDSKPSNPSVDLIRHIRERKDGVLQTWRFYSRASRQSPVLQSPAENHVVERRMENSSWRLWFKQRQEERTLSALDELSNRSTSSLPEDTPFEMDFEENRSDPNLTIPRNE